MKLPAIFITLLLSTFCVLAQDKNKLYVKINHEYKSGTSLNTYKGVFQLEYDTSELLQITDEPENFRDCLRLRRTEIKKFKILLEKMLKFADAVYENEITGVEKEFKDKSLWTSQILSAPQVSIDEDAKPKRKGEIFFGLGGGGPLLLGGAGAQQNY